ncbi:hypothetical protein SRABI27_03482 [Pedobacter sp. Bi27]|nr:hypothetical protein SRABI36_00940 [Pedobacter sp. Bi36]CAH0213418.1 hypothetical protein SRABI126_02032 [Pedobacter sp. Bi126]CAH0270584.1 hypothetical protein SRABI27_03482 [Pedobacter sp. Bi27]
MIFNWKISSGIKYFSSFMGYSCLCLIVRQKKAAALYDRFCTDTKRLFIAGRNLHITDFLFVVPPVAIQAAVLCDRGFCQECLTAVFADSLNCYIATHFILFCCICCRSTGLLDPRTSVVISPQIVAY